MSILVTGGTGFIGSRLVRALCASGEDVVVIDSHPRVERIAGVAHPAKVVVGTNRSIDDLIRVIQEYKVTKMVDMVFAHTPRAEPFPLVRDMAMGVANLLESARLCGINRVLLASSFAVLGPQSAYGPRKVSEQDTVYGTDVYSALKILDERVARAYNRFYGMSNAVVRICHAYGPGPEMMGAGNINTIATYPAVGKPVEIVSRPEDRFVPSHVDDVAEIYRRLLSADRIEHLVYWGGGPSYSWEEMADTVREFIPNAQITFKQPRDARGTNQAFMIDYSRTQTELGFEFRPLRKGVRELINLARERAGLPPVD